MYNVHNLYAIYTQSTTSQSILMVARRRKHRIVYNLYIYIYIYIYIDIHVMYNLYDLYAMYIQSSTQREHVAD